MKSPARLVAAAFAILTGCQSGGSGSASDDPQASCQPALGSHVCSTGPADPQYGLDPAIQSQGGRGGGGGH